jgi:hypothetical protein
MKSMPGREYIDLPPRFVKLAAREAGSLIWPDHGLIPNDQQIDPGKETL